jgi:YidC/Oxa1 family membrane protein insertase
MGLPIRILAWSLVLLASSGAASAAGPVSVETDHLTVRFSEHGSLMLWRACIGAAERPGGRPLCVDYVNAETDASSAQVGKFMPAPDTRVRKEQYPDGTRVVVESPSAGDRVIVREYLFRPRGYRSTLRAFYDGPEARLQVPTTSLHLDMSFLPEPMPGFSSGYAAIRAVFLADGNEQQPADEGDVPIRIPEGGWVGFRSRFWAMLATPLAGSEVTIRALDAVPVMSRMTPRQDTSLPDIARLRVPPGATMLLEADGPELEVDLYTGPVEPGALAEEGDGLESMLYSHVWFWIRPLSNGLRWILDAIQSVVGNVGLSIMLLSVAVKFLMWPLTRLAERWQAEVDRQHARIQPVLDEIRATWRGEERHDRTLAAYRERGISPLYATKSLFGYLIQIPVFIAAFAMLGENVGLAAEPWLWIRDLSRPDALLPLPLAIPFFGQDLNLLPLLMTLVTVVAAAIHTDPNLTPKLLNARRRQLYFLAALFLALFYTFPAAMVLYWTTNNLLHLLTTVAGRIRTSA